MTTIADVLAAQQAALTAQQSAVAVSQSYQPPVAPPDPSFTLTKVATNAYPPLSVAGQRMEFHLHGSGGGFNGSTGAPLYTVGDEYTGTATVFAQSGGAWGSTQNPPKPLPFVLLNPIDQLRTPRFQNGMETLWSGYIKDGVFVPATERWLDDLYAWAKTNLPVDVRRTTFTGNSMGAWGGISYGLRRPDKFAVVQITQPRWKATSVATYDAGNNTTPAGLKCDDGADFAARYDSVAYVADRTHKLPLLIWTIATGDQFSAFADHKAAVAALRARIRDPLTTNAQRSGFAFGWVPGTHGAAGPNTACANVLIWSAQAMTTTYNPDGWRVDLGYPVFDNSSRDDDINTAASGFINAGFAWRNVVESADAWSCEISNTLGDTTVDVYPHSDVFTAQVASQRVTIPAGQWVKVTFTKQSAPTPSDPTPDPVVTPDPSPAVVRPTIHATPVNLTRLVALQPQYQGFERYERYQHHVCLTTDAFSFPFYLTNEAIGGSAAGLSFAYPKYGLYFASREQAEAGDLGTERATYTRTGTERAGVFKGTLGDEADGPYLTTIVAYDANGARVSGVVESLCQFWLWIDRKGTAKDVPWVIVQNGTFDWTHPLLGNLANDPSTYRWCAIPKSAYANPPTYPIAPVVPTPFADAKPANALKLVQYVPGNGGDEMNIRHPAVTSRGITVTDNLQSYFVEDWTKHYPRLPEIDGPRGIATCHFATWLRVGRNAKVYGGTPWSCFMIDANGNRRTLFGLRNKYPLYWEDTKEGGPEIEVVGDWDASIPANERFAWESWGGKFRDRSLALDMNAPAIGGEQPHVAPGPQLFVTDRHGYVLKAQFSANDRSVPARITRLCAGDDPWGLDIDGDVLYISERKRHALVAIDMDTGAKRDILVNPQGSTYGFVDDTNRRWRWAGVTTTPQAQVAIDARRKDCQLLAPEGIAVQDGWLYYGAYALAEVRRVSLTTGEVQVCCRVPLGDITGIQPHYIFVAISDGTFGPRGTLFTTAFINEPPRAWLPVAGTDTDGTPLTHSKQWAWLNLGYEVFGGDSGREDGYQYAMAVDVAKGMLVKASSNRGLDVHVLAETPDTLDDATEYAMAQRGGLYWRTHGYDVLFDQLGYTQHNLPLPWGENADCDFWLQLSGHVKP